MPQTTADIHIVIAGFKDCPYYVRALEVGKAISEKNENVTIEKKEFSREEYHVYREKILKDLGHAADYHKTCPMVFSTFKNVPQVLYGGCDSLVNMARTQFGLPDIKV